MMVMMVEIKIKVVKKTYLALSKRWQILGASEKEVEGTEESRREG